MNPATRDLVNDKTIERVQAIAKRLGYTPDPLARALRTSRTMTIGMVIPDIENPLFGPIIAGVEEALGNAGYSLIIVNTEPNRHDDPAAVTTLLERRVDGMILATAAMHDPALDRLAKLAFPVVLVNRSSDEPAMPSVVVDHDYGIGLAVAHLAELGHRRIGHIAGPQSLFTGLGRRLAFTKAMNASGLDSTRIVEAEWFQVDKGYDACLTLLDRYPETTAIVAANDLLALGAYQALRLRGRSIPNDISVTGYNDLPLVTLTDPPLTSVKVPYRELGRLAGAKMLAQLGTEQVGKLVTRLTPTLSVRGSTGPTR